MPRRLPFSFYPFSIVLFWSACCSAQMAVFSELYLGPDHELFNAFPITSFEEGFSPLDQIPSGKMQVPMRTLTAKFASSIQTILPFRRVTMVFINQFIKANQKA